MLIVVITSIEGSFHNFIIIYSHRRFFIKNGVPNNFAKFTEKRMCWIIVFLINWRPLACTFIIKRRLRHRCFPLNFAKLLSAPFLQNTTKRLLLYRARKHKINPRTIIFRLASCKFSRKMENQSTSTLRCSLGITKSALKSGTTTVGMLVNLFILQH